MKAREAIESGADAAAQELLLDHKPISNQRSIIPRSTPSWKVGPKQRLLCFREGTAITVAGYAKTILIDHSWARWLALEHRVQIAMRQTTLTRCPPCREVSSQTSHRMDRCTPTKVEGAWHFNERNRQPSASRHRSPASLSPRLRRLSRGCRAACAGCTKSNSTLSGASASRQRSNQGLHPARQ